MSDEHDSRTCPDCVALKDLDLFEVFLQQDYYVFDLGDCPHCGTAYQLMVAAVNRITNIVEPCATLDGCGCDFAAIDARVKALIDGRDVHPDDADRSLALRAVMVVAEMAATRLQREGASVQ